MLSDEERKAVNLLKSYENKLVYEISEKDKKAVKTILNLIEKQSKEIEELKASHITTNNKATDTEKAKIFDVIENSIDTYIEKSKPYWEQIMTKDEMTIDEALTIIDDMYQDRYKIMSQKTEKETIVDLSKMDYINFTNLEWASVRALREVQSLLKEIEELKREILEIRDWKYVIDSPIDLDKLKELDLIKIKGKEYISKSIYNELEKERKAYIKGTNDAHELCNKKWEDKIKAKIEELDKAYEDSKNEDGESEYYYPNYTVEVLQSLLEKE